MGYIENMMREANQPEDEVENQHRLISGYRELNAEEIELMNRIKREGENLERLLIVLATVQGVDARWLAIGKTELQQGMMALVRAVARPTTF